MNNKISFSELQSIFEAIQALSDRYPAFMDINFDVNSPEYRVKESLLEAKMAIVKATNELTGVRA